MTQRAFTPHPLVVREVQVRRITEITPLMRRITLGGPELEAFTKDGFEHPAFLAPGFDDHIKLIFASDGDIERALPIQLQHGIEWQPVETRLGRDYTPHHVTADSFELDFVVHGEGPAVQWALHANIGDSLSFVGPKSSINLPDDLDWIVLAGDETALPAIQRFVDERPSEAPATIAVTITRPEARQPLTLGKHDRVEWIIDESNSGIPLLDHLRSLDITPISQSNAAGFAWVAGESKSLLPIRRFFAREIGLPKSNMNITGYWHREQHTHDASQDAVGAATSDVVEPEIAPVASPVAWFAVRAAIELGLLDALADTPGLSTAALSTALEAHPQALDSLLPLLEHHGIVRARESVWELGDFGNELVDDEHEREHFSGPHADAILTLNSLAASVKTGRSAWELHRGESLRSETLTNAELFAEEVEHAGKLAYLLDGFLSEQFWNGVSSCTLMGAGAGVLGDALSSRHADIELQISGTAVEIQTLREQMLAPEAVVWQLTENAAPPLILDNHLTIASLALEHMSMTEASTFLRSLQPCASRVIVLAATRADTLGGEDPAGDLVHFAQLGRARLTEEHLQALAFDAGWSLDTTIPLGWGFAALSFCRTS
ncbi:siderophore-interacting protein [Humidisolicoccus flavus]|uniref:siderophore-interacting protein n=1 Tax=Humidisolicoccus flavus TaxID=3111414 RepID=UPI00325143B5